MSLVLSLFFGLWGPKIYKSSDRHRLLSVTKRRQPKSQASCWEFHWMVMDNPKPSVCSFWTDCLECTLGPFQQTCVHCMCTGELLWKRFLILSTLEPSPTADLHTPHRWTLCVIRFYFICWVGRRKSSGRFKHMRMRSGSGWVITSRWTLVFSAVVEQADWWGKVPHYQLLPAPPPPVLVFVVVHPDLTSKIASQKLINSWNCHHWYIIVHIC